MEVTATHAGLKRTRILRNALGAEVGMLAGS